MRSWTIFLSTLGVGAASALACSSVSPTQACTDLANAICDKLAQCAPPAVTGVYGDTTTCATRAELSCNQALAIKDIADSPGDYDDCSKAYATISCTDAVGNNPPKECAHKPGKVADGSVCGTAAECVSSVCQLDSTGCGKCIEAVAANGTCMATSDCQAGLVCAASTSTTAVCIAPAASGATCSTKLPIAPCQIGLVCDSGKCAAPLTAGSACDPAVQPTLCDSANGYFCTPHGTRCIQALFAGANQPCGFDATNGNFTACSGSGFCGNVSQTTGLGTCIAPAADNGACDLAQGPLCLPPAVCDTSGGADGGTAGTCKVHDPSTCL